MLWWSVLVSAITLAISVGTFWFNRPHAESKRRQTAAINILAARALVFWTQIQRAIDNVNKPVDPYQNQQLCINAKRLEESLDAAIGIGLMNVILRVRTQPIMLDLYTAFTSSLTNAIKEVETMGQAGSTGEDTKGGRPNANKADIDQNNAHLVWLKEFIAFGIILILDQISTYRGLDGDLKAEIESTLKKNTELLQIARSKVSPDKDQTTRPTGVLGKVLR